MEFKAPFGRRARYDVDLAERRYEAVDPANRLIASTLEKRWNDAMQRLLELEAELANFERQTLRTITAEQKRQILQLARDFPRLWTAPTAHDRKRMLRLLIRDITVVKGPEPKRLRLHIRWQGGTGGRHSSAEAEKLAGTESMITLEDCIGLCGLTEEEVLAVAEHEHLPQIAATAFAQYLLSSEHGSVVIRDMIVQDIRLAQRDGNKEHVLTLLHILHHFLVTHPEARPAEHPWSNRY